MSLARQTPAGWRAHRSLWRPSGRQDQIFWAVRRQREQAFTFSVRPARSIVIG
jgi:hypothetical protein